MPFNFRRLPESPSSYYSTNHGGQTAHQPMHIVYEDPMDADDETPLLGPEATFTGDEMETATIAAQGGDRRWDNGENRSQWRDASARRWESPE